MLSSPLSYKLITATLVIVCVVVCAWPARRLYHDLRAQDAQLTIADATVLSHQWRAARALDQDLAPSSRRSLYLTVTIHHEAHPEPMSVLAVRDSPAQYPIGSRLDVVWRDAKRVVLDPQQLTRSRFARSADVLLVLVCFLSLGLTLYARRPAA